MFKLFHVKHLFAAQGKTHSVHVQRAISNSQSPPPTPPETFSSQSCAQIPRLRDLGYNSDRYLEHGNRYFFLKTANLWTPQKKPWWIWQPVHWLGVQIVWRQQHGSRTQRDKATFSQIPAGCRNESYQHMQERATHADSRIYNSNRSTLLRAQWSAKFFTAKKDCSAR